MSQVKVGGGCWNIVKGEDVLPCCTPCHLIKALVEARIPCSYVVFQGCDLAEKLCEKFVSVVRGSLGAVVDTARLMCLCRCCPLVGSSEFYSSLYLNVKMVICSSVWSNCVAARWPWCNGCRCLSGCLLLSPFGWWRMFWCVPSRRLLVFTYGII